MADRIFYHVRRAFSHNGVWYTTQNEQDVVNIPSDELDAKVAAGEVERTTLDDEQFAAMQQLADDAEAQAQMQYALTHDNQSAPYRLTPGFAFADRPVSAPPPPPVRIAEQPDEAAEPATAGKRRVRRDDA